MTPLPTCCSPQQFHSPSGLAWFHERDCPIGRGQKIRNVVEPANRTVQAEELRRSAQHQSETNRAGVVIELRPKPLRVHPACKAAADTGEGAPCSFCSWEMQLDNEQARWYQAKLDQEGL